MGKKIGPLIVGKIKAIDTVIASNWKGLQTFSSHAPNRMCMASDLCKNIHSKTIEFVNRWKYILTKQQRDEWEVYAHGLTHTAKEVANRIGRGKDIIKEKNKLMTGLNAYTRANLLAYTRNIPTPQDIAPFSTPTPLPPKNVEVVCENGIAKVNWQDPPTTMFDANSTVVVTIYVQIQARKRIHSQICGILKVPSPQTYEIKSVRCGTLPFGITLPLTRFISSELRVQMNTVASSGPNIGAIASSSSNLSTTTIK